MRQSLAATDEVITAAPARDIPRWVILGSSCSAPGFGTLYTQALLAGVSRMNIGGFGECLPRFDLLDQARRNDL